MLKSDYFSDQFCSDSMLNVFSDQRCIQAWIDTEIALCKAQAKLYIIPSQVISNIVEVCKYENIDQRAMKVDFIKVGFPILPFVKQLTKLCNPEAARWVHYGATTQDILDTGMVLQIREALILVEKDVDAILNALAKLAETHRNTVISGRTFQQLAAPITFGYKTAIWLDELLRHKDRLEELKPRLLVGQCAGAVGTFATMEENGLEVQRLMMEALGLGVPDITWHTARDRWSELVSLIAMMAATFAKIASEIVILMRSEIGELSEPFQNGRGASTTMPQKRNPIACEPIIANAHRLRELASSQKLSMIQEHERGGLGQMHLEWMVIPESFIFFSGILKHSKFILENLWVDKESMRENLNLQGGLIMSEAVMMGLAPKVGKNQAHQLVYAAAGMANDAKITLKEAILLDKEIMQHISEAELDKLLDPSNYTGSAGAMVDRVLEKYKKTSVSLNES